MKKHKNFEDTLNENLENPTFREAYEHYHELLNIGIKMRQIRLKAGLTQKQMANKIGVSQQVIAQLENGSSNPTIKTLSKVAEAAARKLVLDFV